MKWTDEDRAAHQAKIEVARKRYGKPFATEIHVEREAPKSHVLEHIEKLAEERNPQPKLVTTHTIEFRRKHG